MPNTQIYERTNYETSMNFIKNATIYEFDLEKANISVMVDLGIISEDEYNKLAILPKDERERSVGLMMRDDRTLSNKIKSEIIRLKKCFFEENHIKDSQVIRIANDAIYVNGFASVLKFGNHEQFRLKNKYSLYARVNDLLFFFGSNLGDLNMDVIGLGKEQIALHEDYMLNFIGNLFWAMEFNEVSFVMDFFNDFYKHYLSRELLVPYYRELNPDSMYRLLTGKNGVSYGVSVCDDPNKLDIGFNANVLRQLFGYISWMNEERR